MATPNELSEELFENISFNRKLANKKASKKVGQSKFEDIWLERLFEVVAPWEKRINLLKVGKPFPENFEEKFTKSFSEAFKNLAIVDLEFRGLKQATAAKLVNSLLK